jgi:hypothetical protein
MSSEVRILPSPFFSVHYSWSIVRGKISLRFVSLIVSKKPNLKHQTDPAFAGTGVIQTGRVIHMDWSRDSKSVRGL